MRNDREVVFAVDIYENSADFISSHIAFNLTFKECCEKGLVPEGLQDIEVYFKTEDSVLLHPISGEAIDKILAEHNIVHNWPGPTEYFYNLRYNLTDKS